MPISRTLAAMATAGLIAGCAVPPPIPSVSPADIAAASSALAAAGVSPADYADIGYLLNVGACNGYLLKQAAISGTFGMASSGASLAGMLAAAGLATSGAGTPAMALTGVAAGGLASSLGLLAGNTGIPYSAATAQKVQEAMLAYMTAAPMPATLPRAAILVEDMRWLCTPPGITWIAAQAIATATITAGSPQATSFSAAPRRFAVPVVRVNGR